MGLLVHTFKFFGCNSKLNESGELPLVWIFIILHELTHVVGNMFSQKMVTKNLSTKILRFLVISRETFLTMRNFNTAINSSLHNTKDTSSSGSTGKACIKVGTESSGTIIIILNTVHFTVNFSLALIGCIKAKLVQQPSCKKKSSAVTGSIVCDSHNQAVFRGVVFVLGLDNEPLASIVICLSFTPPLELDLEALEVLLVLNNLHVPHLVLI